MKKLTVNGYTLVEIVIALTISSALLTMISIFAIDSLRNSSVESAKASLLGESQITMDRVISDIRLSARADTVNRWPDANKAGGDFSWSSNSGTLVLATAVVDSGNNIIFTDPQQYISEKNNVIYFLENGILYKRVLASTVSGNSLKTTCPSAQATEVCPADKEMIKNVSNFSLQYFDGNNQEVSPDAARSIVLTIQTQTSRFGRNVSSDYSTRAVFRND